MSDIPDPTELRAKLGIALRKPDARSPEEYVNGRIPEIKQQNALGRKGVTLTDEEAEPRYIDDAEAETIERLLKDCPPACAKWMKKYIVLGNPSAASRAISYSAAMPSYWKKSHPAFKAMFEFYHAEVRERWNEVVESRALGGFKDEVFKPDGSLKFTRMRQDPQFMVQLMKKMDPDWKDDQLGTQINITVVREGENE